MTPTTAKGKYIVRFAICAKSSKQEDIDYSWQEIKRCAELVIRECEEPFTRQQQQPPVGTQLVKSKPDQTLASTTSRTTTSSNTTNTSIQLIRSQSTSSTTNTNPANKMAHLIHQRKQEQLINGEEQQQQQVQKINGSNGSNGNQVKLLNGKMNVPAVMNRSMSDISVVSLPRLNDLKTAYANLLEAAGEDIGREGLLKTPERAAKAFQFFTGGYHQDLRG